MPLSAKNMVAALFSVPFSITVFLLLETQKKILQNIVRYTDRLRVFLSLPLVFYLEYFSGYCPQVLCNCSATAGKHLLGESMQHNAVCQRCACICSKETMFCKHYGFGSSCCMSGELIILATGRTQLLPAIYLPEPAHPLFLPLSLGLSWHSAV